MILLASTSPTRRAMLEAAGVPFAYEAPRCDEEELKLSLRAERVSPRDQADALAEAKALSVSRLHRGVTVIGSDQMLETPDGGWPTAWMDKPTDRADAEAQLRALVGKTHRLHSAAVAVRDGQAVWRQIESVALTVRPLSDGFIRDYLDAEWAEGHHGLYRIEGRGVQLFDHVRGNHFAILGLPLMPLLAWLRAIGELPA